jgi:hypothetical protein
LVVFIYLYILVGRLIEFNAFKFYIKKEGFLISDEYIF